MEEIARLWVLLCFVGLFGIVDSRMGFLVLVGFGIMMFFGPGESLVDWTLWPFSWSGGSP